jgi:hypothetical protein
MDFGEQSQIARAIIGSIRASDSTAQPDAAPDVVRDVVTMSQQLLEHVGVIGVEREHFLPRALIENELQRPDTILSGVLGDPAELIVRKVANANAVISHRLGDVDGRHFIIRSGRSRHDGLL